METQTTLESPATNDEYPDYYGLLGLYPSAEPHDIEAAWDRADGSSEKMRMAYDVLRDLEQREIYNQAIGLPQSSTPTNPGWAADLSYLDRWEFEVSKPVAQTIFHLKGKRAIVFNRLAFRIRPRKLLYDDENGKKRAEPISSYLYKAREVLQAAIRAYGATPSVYHKVWKEDYTQRERGKSPRFDLLIKKAKVDFGPLDRMWKMSSSPAPSNQAGTPQTLPATPGSPSPSSASSSASQNGTEREMTQ